MFTYCCLSDFNFQISLNVFARLLQQSTNPRSFSLNSVLFLLCPALVHHKLCNLFVCFYAFSLTYHMWYKIKLGNNGAGEGGGNVVNSLNRKVCPLIQVVLIAASDRIMPQRQNSSLKLQHAGPVSSDSKHFKNKGEG